MVDLSSFQQRILGFPAQAEDDLSRARWGQMGQIGLALMGASGRMPAGQRGAALAAGLSQVQDPQQVAMNYAQQRLLQSVQQAKMDEINRNSALRQKLTDPAYLKGLGMNPQAAEVLGPEGIANVIQSQAARDPLDRQVKIAQLNALSKPKWETTGYNEFGKPIRSLVDPEGKVLQNDDGTAPGAPRVSVTDQVRGLSGIDVITKLKEIDPGLAAQVDAIASGRQAFPTSLMRSQRGEVISDLVNMVDPNYSAATFSTRKKMQEGAAGTTLGSLGGQTTFGNTAIKHLGELYSLVDELGNYGGFPGSRMVNKIGNAWADQSGKGTVQNRWNATATNAADEIAKFYGAGGVTEREKLKELFDASRSPQELKAVIEESIKDIYAKTSNLQNQWNEVMGPYAGGKKFIYDDTQGVVDNINGVKKPEAAGPAIKTIRQVR